MLDFRRFAVLLSAAAVLGGLSSASRADEWPSRPVTVVVPFGAGGNTDMMARLGAQRRARNIGG
jgi:tripartite-type tricarboxylate transporter receptor subunit TctC